MRFLIVVLALFSLAFADQWEEYKARHNKYYVGREDKVRKEIFLKNLELINKHNELHRNGMKKYTLGANRFADMTNEEFRKFFNGLKMTQKKVNSSEQYYRKGLNVPDTVDWRTHEPKIVGPVKNQAQCGSCWAFSAVSSIESQNALKTGKYVSLSEQQVMDCSHPYGNQGCEGGLMDSAFKYIETKGLDTENSYPYEAADDTCRFKPGSVAAKIRSYKDVPAGDESALREAVATVGPISVAIDASNFSFQLYSGGIYDEESCSSSALDHGVVAVGYGSENGQDYWLVRNSWGPQWGEEGYIKMSRNKDNQCGIASMASYPIV